MLVDAIASQVRGVRDCNLISMATSLLAQDSRILSIRDRNPGGEEAVFQSDDDLVGQKSRHIQHL